MRDLRSPDEALDAPEGTGATLVKRLPKARGVLRRQRTGAEILPNEQDTDWIVRPKTTVIAAHGLRVPPAMVGLTISAITLPERVIVHVTAPQLVRLLEIGFVPESKC